MPALTILFPFLFPEPTPTIPFSHNEFPSKIDPKVPTSVPRNPPLYSLVSFLTAFVTSFNNISESSRAWTFFIISFTYSFEIIKFVIPEPNIFFWIPESIAKAAAIISYLAKIFFAIINAPANLLNNDPKKPPDQIILEIWALESFMSVNILLLNAFLSFIFCLVVSNNSWGRSFPSSFFKLILRDI